MAEKTTRNIDLYLALQTTTPRQKMGDMTMEALAIQRPTLESTRDIKREIVSLMGYRQVQALISLRAYYESAAQYELELSLFAKRQDVSLGENHGFWIGIDSIRKYRVEWSKLNAARNLAATNQRFPNIDNTPENLGSGCLAVHPVTTPIIEIAGDGFTAKAMWYSPGMVIDVSPTQPSGFVACWSWKRYAVDFVREDNHWRFWHFNVLTDWNTEFLKSPVTDAAKLSASSNRIDPTSTEFSGPLQSDIPPPDLKRCMYQSWHPGRVPRIYPMPPVPYETFSETFDYGPDAMEYS